MAEAMNELTFLATGIYGHPLPKQHGAPLRLVVPWKYGFKSIKSIVKIKLVAAQPRTTSENASSTGSAAMIAVVRAIDQPVTRIVK